MSQQPAPWPFNITDPVRAVHFALDKGDCLFPDPLSCPTEATARAAVPAYRAWAASQSPETVLAPAERQFLSFALDLAADHMANRGDEFDEEDETALARLRQMVQEAGQ